jgi:hypothetical protein
MSMNKPAKAADKGSDGAASEAQRLRAEIVKIKAEFAEIENGRLSSEIAACAICFGIGVVVGVWLT